MTNLQKVQVYLEPDVYQWLQGVAAAEDRKLSYIARRAIINDMVAQQETEKRPEAQENGQQTTLSE